MCAQLVRFFARKILVGIMTSSSPLVFLCSCGDVPVAEGDVAERWG